MIEDEPQPSAAGPSTQLPAEVSDGERDRPYVAVVSQIERTEAFPAQEEAPLFPSRERARREIDTYPTDIPIAIAAALLAASVFLEWYKGPGGLRVSGWVSGTLAPLIVFLAAGSVVLVVLRRLRVGVTLPVEESLAHEAAGWLSLVAAVVKSRWRPSLIGFGFNTSYGVWITIGAAALLVVLAGRMSPRAPLVFRPGWHRGRAGTVGALVLLVAIAGSAVFGATNSPKFSDDSSNPQTFPGTVEGRVPECAKDFPFPQGLKPINGSETQCFVQFTSERQVKDLLASFKKKLKDAGWTYSETGSSTLNLTRPRCATLAFLPDRDGGSAVVLIYDRCVTPSPSPTPR